MLPGIGIGEGKEGTNAYLSSSGRRYACACVDPQTFLHLGSWGHLSLKILHRTIRRAIAAVHEERIL